MGGLRWQTSVEGLGEGRSSGEVRNTAKTEEVWRQTLDVKSFIHHDEIGSCQDARELSK